ncbi:MAG: efflux RND transporter periplasmic adaptor subunit [Chloroflexi bacterium]|nr:efflux RND transporter periplasmic adaptor subunit [Chloroflexota bacterium]
MTNHALPHRRPVPRRLLALGLAAVVLLLAILALLNRLQPTPSAPPPLSSPSTPVAGEARGRLVPATWANVSPSVPGRVSEILVREGQEIGERQELLRLESEVGTVSLVAPFRGTVAQILPRRGETVLAGQPAVVIGDLSRLVVETTDLNEYGVARIAVGQRATLSFEAIDGLVARGVVRSIALRGQPNASGEITYPTVIDLDRTDPRLRWGMTVQVRFEE